MPSTAGLSRRTALKVFGGAAGAGMALAGGSGLTASRSTVQSRKPRVEWARYYEGTENDYQFHPGSDSANHRLHTAIVQTADGGYALAASGDDIEETYHTGPHMALIKLDSNGEYNWHTFSKEVEDGEDEYKRAVDLIQTDHRDYVLLGYENRVVKLDSDGNETWATKVQPEEYDEGGERGPLWHPTGGIDFAVDGGYIVGVTFGYQRPGLAKLGQDGAIVWHKRYYNEDDRDQRDHLINFVPVDDGYVFIHDRDLPQVINKVDGDGDLQRNKELSSDTRFTDIEQAHDDGYVLTGWDRDDADDSEDWDMVLVKLDADWDREWRKQYDGPFEGTDRSTSVTKTDDGGYAITGSMSEAYTADRTATVLRTDGDGNKQWHQLITVTSDEGDGAVGYPIVQTDDGGFAVTVEHYDHDMPGAAKVDVTEEDGSTPTEPPTPTESPTESPPESPTDSPEETPTEPSTDSPTDRSTETPDTVITETGTARGAPGFGALTAVGGLLGGVAYVVLDIVRGSDK